MAEVIPLGESSLFKDEKDTEAKWQAESNEWLYS